MMSSENSEITPTPSAPKSAGELLRTFSGIFLILLGVIFLLDFYFKTGWLTLILLPIPGVLLYAGGWRGQRFGLVITGSLLGGLGLAISLALSQALDLSIEQRIGAGLLAFGLSWALITLASLRLTARTAWWALIPGSVLAGTGLTFLFSSLKLVDFILYIGFLLGLAFLSWGLGERLFGLIIPGCLLSSIGPGVYLAWSSQTLENPLARTGIMLVAFALGWVLITVCSRRVTHQFVWWPLIPGGVLAMVGWGLYIGGNPSNAAAFIGNTGSLAMILFGVYLLLMRRGIQR